MTTFGPQLRSAREEKGWSIDYVSFKSKIQPNIIEDLEADDYSCFTSQSYVKSFLRKYSEFLDLDFEEEIADLEIVGYVPLDRYAAREGVKENLEMTEFSTRNERFRKAQKTKGSPVFLVGSVVVLLSGIATFYYLGSQANKPAAGALDTASQFESVDSAFSRQREAKERLVSQKTPFTPISASRNDPAPLASTRSSPTSISSAINPLDDLNGIEKPDVKKMGLPELQAFPETTTAQPTIEMRQVNPLLDF